jgi:hypothetical protein
VRKRKLIISLGVIGLLAATLVMAATTAKPAQASPSKKSECSTCHSAAPIGSVTATPSKTTLAPGEAYSVNIAIDLSAGGTAGFWIVGNNASTSSPDLTGGPGSSPFTASLTAPATPGAYVYKVYGVKGVPDTGQTATTTYSITVATTPTPPTPPTPPNPPTPPTPPTPGDTTPPTTLAPQAAHVKAGHEATLKYQVNDLGTSRGKADVTIVISTRSGKIVQTLKAGSVSVNRPQRLHFRVTLKKGTYVFTVMATDAAGNASTVNGSNELTVSRGSHDDGHDEGHDHGHGRGR